MSKLRLVAEFGSCHNNKLERIKEAIDRCKKAKIDALKLQLFPNEAPYVGTGNVWLDPKIFKEAFKYAKKKKFKLTASVFDFNSYCFLQNLEPAFIKFSYGKKHEEGLIKETLAMGREAIVSCDVMTDHLVPDNATKLYCIPEYPVRYEVAFDGLFNTYDVSEVAKQFPPNQPLQVTTKRGRFDGFSDHTMGMRQTARAVCAGAKIIEKHVRLGYEDETCPDAFFAVTIEEFAAVRGVSNGHA